ncbi:MAG: hypothetical protein LQ348_006108 [Seirophora lacunosa]|nr:MAG: hypothetical protein LQ348_006108 [Seirophora lacunosa]
MESEQCSAPSLDAIQRADDISATLRLAREAILANDRFCQEVEEQCALNITKIWEYIDQRERSEPHHARLIHQWRQEITQAIRHQTIEHYKTLAAASQHRIDRYRVRIRQAWGVESSQVLEPKHYKQGQGLSHECLRSLAHLSEHVPLETGRGLLIHQIQHRTLSKVTGFRDTDVHLKPRDVKRALAATGVQTAETAESSDLDPSASAPAPRGHSTEPQSQPPTNRPSGQAPRRKRKTNYFYSSKGKLRKLPEVARSVSPSFTHASNTTDVDPVVDPDADSVVDSAARSGEEEAVTINGECTPDIELARTQTGPNLSVLDSPNWTHSPVPSETGSGVDLESMASRDSHFPGEPSDVHAIGAEPQSMLEHAYRGAAQAHDVASIDVMPESTLQAALNSLVPGERLTTTAMDWILGSFNADRYKFLDPACLDCETPGSQAPRPSTSDWSSTEFMIPMYHVEEHWTLGTLEAGRANLYDSLRSTMHEKDAEKVLDPHGICCVLTSGAYDSKHPSRITE